MIIALMCVYLVVGATLAILVVRKRPKYPITAFLGMLFGWLPIVARYVLLELL